MKHLKKHLVIPGPALLVGRLTRNPSGFVIGLLLSLLLIVLGINILLSYKPRKTISLKPTFSTDFAYDNRTFLHAVAENKSIGGSIPSVVILPHHLLASTIIAEGISMLARQSPKTIIILSPNHANTGQCDIVTSRNSWETPFGQMDVDLDIQKIFLDSKIICTDDTAMQVEHGVAGLLPFIKYYLPNTKVVPLALKKEIDPNSFKIFTQKLIEVSKNSTILASIDFSHGLSQKESLKRDSQTKSLIANLNYSELEKLSSEYIDSPISLISALSVINSYGSKPEFLVHSDSSAFNRDTKDVTSYFLISDTPSLRGTPRQSTGSNDSFTLVFGGDVMLGRSVNTRMLKYSDFTWPFLKISTLLSQADLTLVNLESPFRSGCKESDSGMVFCADPRSIEGLLAAGVDVVNLANNHIDNQGKEGITETLEILNKNNIVSVGVDPRDHPTPSNIFTIKNTKIAFLGFDDIRPVSSEVTSATPENIKTQIAEAKKMSDLVVATFHWGSEYSSHNSGQEYLAHLAIDSGADLVIGHHPHWVQEFEEYKSKPIYYSLGNLVFDQMWSDKTRNGLVVRFTYTGSDLLNREEFPIKIFDYGQPALLYNK